MYAKYVFYEIFSLTLSRRFLSSEHFNKSSLYIVFIGSIYIQCVKSITSNKFLRSIHKKFHHIRIKSLRCRGALPRLPRLIVHVHCMAQLPHCVSPDTVMSPTARCLERFFQNVHRMAHDYDIFKPRLSDNTECMKYIVYVISCTPHLRTLVE